MKKFIVVALAVAMSACASHKGCQKAVEEQEVYTAPAYVAPVQYQVRTTEAYPGCPCAAAVAMPMPTDPCRCAYQPNPCRQNLKPRIHKPVVQKPRRHCPADGQMINCGCGNCQTFQNSQIQQPEPPLKTFALPGQPATIVPEMPDAYALASSRVFNRFIKDTYSIYGTRPGLSVYVKPAKGLSRDLPGGVNRGVENFKNQLARSYTFTPANDQASADYVVETSVDWFDTPTKTVPAILYRTAMYDKQGNKINEWVEIIKKADNSEAWL